MAKGRKELRLGIDFGTTHTVAAVCDRGNYPVVTFTGEAGDALEAYPSIVAERDGELRFGLDALPFLHDPSWTTLRSFKRILSDPLLATDRTIRVGTVEIPLIDLLAGFLTTFRRDLVSRSNLRPAQAEKETIRVAAATPANAHSTQRFLTMEAFRRAGFDVIALLNEPSAAGLEYAHRYRSTLTSKRERVVVYDLGGGTFDASLVRMAGLHHDVVSTSGIPRLGGDDFDEKLAGAALREGGMSPEELPPGCLALLVEQCRQIKEGLGPNTRRITVDLKACLGDGARTGSVTFPVDAFYDACAPLVERTLEEVDAILRAGMEPPDEDVETELAGIYVVGGASALPLVGRMLRERFGRRMHRSPYPFAATAIGLAIAADEDAGFVLTDQLSRHFGVFREAEHGTRINFDPIFTKDVRLPGRAGGTLVSRRTYHAVHNVGHFRYAECLSLDEETGAPRGDLVPFADIHFPFDESLRNGGTRLDATPVRRMEGEGPRIEERYSVDANGIIEVTISDLGSGYSKTHRLAG